MKRSRDVAAKGAKERFFETLSSFVDPYVNPTGAGPEHTVCTIYLLRSRVEEHRVSASDIGL